MTSSFSSAHWSLVQARAEKAEELTRRFYSIPGREWDRVGYDVTTGGLAEEAPGRLARVVKLARERARARSSRALFRIELDDAAILGAARPSRGVQLGPLLLYVLAHELVHVVRFGVMGQEFDLAPRERDAEERRVHDLSKKILEPLGDPGLLPVFRAYAPPIPAAMGG